jgi:hypothetical protein
VARWFGLIAVVRWFALKRKGLANEDAWVRTWLQCAYTRPTSSLSCCDARLALSRSRPGGLSAVQVTTQLAFGGDALATRALACPSATSATSHELRDVEQVSLSSNSDDVRRASSFGSAGAFEAKDPLPLVA